MFGKLPSGSFWLVQRCDTGKLAKVRMDPKGKPGQTLLGLYFILKAVDSNGGGGFKQRNDMEDLWFRRVHRKWIAERLESRKVG